MYPILEHDISYELEIIKNPYELGPWLRYIQFKQDRPLAEQSFVFERACTTLGRSYKLWKIYLDLRVNHLKKASYKKYPNEFHKVNALYEKALVLLNKMPRLWTDYLEFLLQQQPDNNVAQIRRTFNRALQALPITQHRRIWSLYIEFANSANPLTTIRIWERYVMFEKDKVEEFIQILINHQHYQRAAERLMQILVDDEFVSANGKSRFQLYQELLEILIHHSPDIEGINIEQVIRSGIEKYADQKGLLYVNLATYWINQGIFENARDVMEEGISNALTVRDFTQIFDSYAEFEENLISRMMTDADANEVDRRMESFEQLMDRRPFILNDVLLRKNPHDVTEWEKRIGLWGNDTEQVVNTYAKAIETIDPNRATNGRICQLWINYAKFYEKGSDLSTARIIFDKATKVHYKSVNELADVWIEWSEMELRQENFDGALKVLKTATQGPRHSTVDYFDESKPPQERLHKSMKVWSFYIDLTESIGEIDQVKPLYDRVFALKIGTPLTIVNYANFLEENQYFEQSFKVFERGIELFPYPTAFELWNLYLNKAINRKLGIERLRDLFEQALADCPKNLSKSIFLLYGKLEEDRGLVRNALKVYDRAIKHVDDKDKLEVYRYYISRVVENFGLPATRPIFQQAIDNLNDAHANAICMEFIDVEQKLGEVDRARALFGFASQFNNPVITQDSFWNKWEKFEVNYGSEDTYKEMLRIKRSVRAQFNTDIGYMASQVVRQQQNGEPEEEEEEAQQQEQNNAMEMLEKQVNAPMGFVASSENPQKIQNEHGGETNNPDAIDIDIDM